MWHTAGRRPGQVMRCNQRVERGGSSRTLTCVWLDVWRSHLTGLMRRARATMLRARTQKCERAHNCTPGGRTRSDPAVGFIIISTREYGTRLSGALALAANHDARAHLRLVCKTVFAQHIHTHVYVLFCLSIGWPVVHRCELARRTHASWRWLGALCGGYR